MNCQPAIRLDRKAVAEAIAQWHQGAALTAEQQDLIRIAQGVTLARAFGRACPALITFDANRIG